MKINIALWDRVLRMCFALVIGTICYFHFIDGNWRTVMVIMAGLFALSSIIGICPMYCVFGINTMPHKDGGVH